MNTMDVTIGHVEFSKKMGCSSELTSPVRPSSKFSNLLLEENTTNSSVPRVSKKRCRRFRGKRKPKRKENRRRVRHGKSRTGFMIGAPFNDNEFLLSQRQSVVQFLEGKLVHIQLDNPFDSTCEKKLCRNSQSCPCSPTFSQRFCATSRGSCEICSEGSASGETSDYSSLHSPTGSISKPVDGGEDSCVDDFEDEVFDEEFAMRNFEADYSAQQREMREDLMKISRQELEERCLALMDQEKDLEERCQIYEERRRIRDLEQELESLTEENRWLRGNCENLSSVDEIGTA